jgi:hypothetical protein
MRVFHGLVAQAGHRADPELVLHVGRAQAGGLSSNPTTGLSRLDDFALSLENPGTDTLILTLADMAYGRSRQEVVLLPGGRKTISWNLAASHHWYDIGITVSGYPDYLRRCAGHMETGHGSRTDPAAVAPVWT